ncbi:MAG: UvrD/REP helicase [Myxococcales bacterium]|nr:UvrD/REP helicase [Myxococcales bacterium]
MSIKIITASAGSGKTTRLSEVLDQAIGSGGVRPEAIVATTFTRHAAAELIERARGRLLASGRGREAHQLLAARIGTVNAVCGSLVTDFAFELGLSPSLRVLDEASAELEQKRALAGVVSSEISDELFRFSKRFYDDFNWHQEVRRLIEAARSNALDAHGLRACATRSMTSLDACLGPVAAETADQIDQALVAAIDTALSAIDLSVDTTKGTATYVDELQDARRDLLRHRLRWGDWAMLTKAKGTKASLAHAAPVQAVAARHLEHPGLRTEMHRLIELLFQVAADGLAAYQDHKRERGVIDFVDQEALALQLLRRPDIREALTGQLDLVLIDEFQDTSPLQLAIFLELASLARESVWVGDQKQAIYGFRGTDPALMDAMIESLTSTTTDPDLVSSAVRALGHAGERETLSTSYRSRPALVELTSDLFARAFVEHGIPEDRTRLAPFLKDEPAGLGPILEYWPLTFPDRENKDVLAAAAATGVRDLLQTATKVRDRRTGKARDATAADVAVLCRTNEQCQLIADALAALDIAAVVPRLELFDTAEGHVVAAGLRLWIDGRDALAAAQIARLVSYATDMDGFVARALAAPGHEAFAGDPIVRAIVAARDAAPDLDPAAVVAAIIDAAGLRELCAGWGNTAQRHANLDALRAHAIAYVHQATSRREPPSLVGLLAHFDTMVEVWGWRSSRTDDQALLAGAAAVTVSTWHAAKGREWPVTVLYGLETLREPRAFGMHVESDAAGFDLAAPLAGRWLRYWPNPYTKSNQLGPVMTAYAGSDELKRVKERAEREALRLLYVGWTRARDRLIFAAAEGKLLKGLVGTISRLVPGLIAEPPAQPGGDVAVTWGGHAAPIRVQAKAGVVGLEQTSTPGELAIGRPPRTYPPARLLPSTVEGVPCTLGTHVTLGPRLTLRGAPEMGLLGDAMHAFFAVDRAEHPATDRTARATALLRSYGVADHLDPSEVATAATRLWTWLTADLGATRLHREWPVGKRTADGTLVGGTADLVARTAAGFVLVDHKTFPGSLDDALARLPKYSGQLATYARVITAAMGIPVVSMWIHLPVLGIVVSVELG